ncbi:MAG TPA: aminoacyl-tRNA deacylase [Dehalococcoidia bacterium]|nr:aminoacyl-tRNA deacylase [Dehalococcoidia bacterium]
MKKRHAIRVLDSKHIPYRVTEYDSSGEFHTGEEAAVLVGAPAEAVYKTLVVLRDAAPAARSSYESLRMSGGKPMIVMVPVALQVDLKALAEALGEKRLRMATQKEAEKLTGMQVGGISALALPRPGFTVLIDERARELDRIHVSAGARGMDIELAVSDLVALTGAKFVRATR